MAKKVRWLVLPVMMFGAMSGAFADDTGGAAVSAAGDQTLAQEDRIAELERTVKILAEELERTRSEMAVPEESALTTRKTGSRSSSGR